MSELTEEEWGRVQQALVIGGLRNTVNELLWSREQERGCIPINDHNRALLYRAYDDGDGDTLDLELGHDEYFLGTYGESIVMWGTEIKGVLYSICPVSGGGRINVLVGDEICGNTVGPIFSSVPEAKAYIRGFTTK